MSVKINEVAKLSISVKENAESLLDEAKLLFSKKYYQRSFSLSFMAMEELGKLPILWGVMTRTQLGEEIDWKSVWKRFRSHSSKEFQGYGIVMYTYLECKENIKDGKVLEAVGHLCDKDISRNESLYVDYKGGKIISPSGRIDKKDADSMMVFSRFLLDLAQCMHENEEQIIKTVEKSAETFFEKKENSKFFNFLEKLK